MVYSAGGGWDMIEDEAQRLLTKARKDLGLAAEPIRWLPNPVLDGLASLAPELL